ncbi:MAG TPA: hypothetical protein VHK06_04555 [Candidatus Limnocylindria bacterium]|nr:hypothetical protein [Candidatus Limnocylindria bacterium]
MSASVLLLVLLTSLSTPTVLASDPSGSLAGGGNPPSNTKILPLSREQKESRRVKEEIIARVGQRTATGGTTTNSCPTPTSVSTSVTSSTEPAVTTNACYTPSKWVLGNINPRQQEKWYWCGPAVGQVMSNYTWGMGASANKYSQSQIASWMRTEINGQTFLGDFIYGVNRATRRPSNFVYMQKHAPSFSNWHNTIIAGVYSWRLPLAAGVNPHAIGSSVWIISWPQEKNAAHYIELHGYEGYASTANGSRWVYYSDTAGPYAAAGMRAGNFKDISYDVYRTMMMNTGDMVY